MSYIYLLRSQFDDVDVYKIGYSKNPKQRLKELKTGNPNIEIVATFKTKHNRKIETALHNQHKYKNVNGEWFYLMSHDVDNFLPQCETMEKNFDTLKSAGNPYI